MPPPERTTPMVPAHCQSERTQHEVHGHEQARDLGPRRDLKVPIGHRDDRVGRADVNLVRIQVHALLGMVDRHRRSRGKKLRQDALTCRIEVLDEQDGHAGFGRQVPQQSREGIEATGRSADADHGKPRPLGRIRYHLAWPGRAFLFLACPGFRRKHDMVLASPPLARESPRPVCSRWHEKSRQFPGYGTNTLARR